jgi:phytanoyl-CoA hydroxylase
MTKDEQATFFSEHGYLHVPEVYTATQIEALSDDLDRLVQEWAMTTSGWTGPWRNVYMDPEIERKSKLTAMHDLHLYSAEWMRAVTHPRLAEVLCGLLGQDVELHHSTLHIKPPQTGQPFPMHQDYPFYEHEDARFVDVLVHLDDTSHANGEIRFLDGSHKSGKLPHITETADGPCTPHLPPDEFRLEDTVAVPARRGDVVLFSIHTVHGSYINTTDQPRRLVRVGYRHPHNRQIAGQSVGRPGLMVSGYRSRRANEPLLRSD